MCHRCPTGFQHPTMHTHLYCYCRCHEGSAHRGDGFEATLASGCSCEALHLTPPRAQPDATGWSDAK